MFRLIRYVFHVFFVVLILLFAWSWWSSHHENKLNSNDVMSESQLMTQINNNKKFDSKNKVVNAYVKTVVPNSAFTSTSGINFHDVKYGSTANSAIIASLKIVNDSSVATNSSDGVGIDKITYPKVNLLIDHIDHSTGVVYYSAIKVKSLGSFSKIYKENNDDQTQNDNGNSIVGFMSKGLSFINDKLHDLYTWASNYTKIMNT